MKLPRLLITLQSIKTEAELGIFGLELIKFKIIMALVAYIGNEQVEKAVDEIPC